MFLIRQFLQHRVLVFIFSNIFFFQNDDERMHFFRQTVMKFVQCLTILVKALLLKQISLEKPPSFIGEWNLDVFLYEHKTRLESAVKEGRKFRIMYPGYNRDTKFEDWDLEMVCLVLKRACNLKPRINELLNNLQDLKHRLKTARESRNVFALDCRLDDILNYIIDYIGSEQLKNEIKSVKQKVKKIPDTDWDSFWKDYGFLIEWESEGDITKNLEELNGGVLKLGTGMLSNSLCLCCQ